MECVYVAKSGKQKSSQIACVNVSNWIKQRIWLVEQTIFEYLVLIKTEWINIYQSIEVIKNCAVVSLNSSKCEWNGRENEGVREKRKGEDEEKDEEKDAEMQNGTIS